MLEYATPIARKTWATFGLEAARAGEACCNVWPRQRDGSRRRGESGPVFHLTPVLRSRVKLTWLLMIQPSAAHAGNRRRCAAIGATAAVGKDCVGKARQGTGESGVSAGLSR